MPVLHRLMHTPLLLLTKLWITWRALVKFICPKGFFVGAGAANNVATAVSNNTMNGNSKYAERTIITSQLGRVGVTVTPFVQRVQQHWAANTMVQPLAQEPIEPMQEMQPMMQAVQQQLGQYVVLQPMMPHHQMKMMAQHSQMQQGMQPMMVPMQQVNRMAPQQQYGVPN